MDKSYLTIENIVENLIIIEKSKFICYLKGVSDENDAKNFVKEISKMNSLATHNCYAYIADELGLIKKFSDDGEPQGTAGYPMLDVLLKSNLKKVVVVCTRYFGGIKLGAGGLVRAYSGSVSEAIKKAKLVLCKMSNFCLINCGYDNYDKILSLLRQNSIKIIKTDFADCVSMEIVICLEDFDRIKSLFLENFNGENIIKLIKQDYYPFG